MTKNNLPFKEKKPITSPYGYRMKPFPGFHNGVDFGGVGDTTEVLAIEDGYIYNNKDMFGGLYCWHVAGNRSWIYLHLSQFLKPNGAKVKQREPIGITGKTGLAFGYHLHLGLKVNDTYIDPVPTLNQINKTAMKDQELYNILKTQRPDVTDSYNADNVLLWWNEFGIAELWFKLGELKRKDVLIITGVGSLRDWYVYHGSKEYGNIWNA